MRTILFLLALCTTANSLLYAQSTDTTAVELAASRYALSNLLNTSDAVAFDTTAAATSSGKVAHRTAHQNAELRKAINARTSGKLSDYVECSLAIPGKCKMSGATMVISFDQPEIRGDSASINVRLTRFIGLPRVPINFESRQLIFGRRGRDWVFVKLGVIVSS